MRSALGSEYIHLFYNFEFGKRNFWIRSGWLRTKTSPVRK
jgi:hypothetical protein